MKSTPVALITSVENRTSSVAKDAKMVNAYGDFETQQKGYVVKRPGYALNTQYDVAAVQGVVSYLSVTRVVINNKFYTTSVAYTEVDTAGELVDFA